ncbi:MAG: MarR family winged helix-turn-helix transcriptional regulator [Opitutaceae bacterium]
MHYSCVKQVPRYADLLLVTRHFPELDPSATEAYLHLLRAADDVLRKREASLAEAGLSCGRFMVLIQLLNKQENRPQARTPAELADLAGVTRATMTGLIDTLERDGLVRRHPDSNDRRMMEVHLTRKGEDALRRVLPRHFRLMATLMSPLSESERKTLVALVSRILPGPDAAGDEPSDGSKGIRPAAAAP